MTQQSLVFFSCELTFFSKHLITLDCFDINESNVFALVIVSVIVHIRNDNSLTNIHSHAKKTDISYESNSKQLNI